MTWRTFYGSHSIMPSLLCNITTALHRTKAAGHLIIISRTKSFCVRLLPRLRQITAKMSVNVGMGCGRIVASRDAQEGLNKTSQTGQANKPQQGQQDKPQSDARTDSFGALEYHSNDSKLGGKQSLTNTEKQSDKH